ncbi:MAG: XRE family transcriptional regulator [Anaerolineae bacterium]|nr:XRE family transcriptional regulator [Anaerolineae bacterium]
MTRSSPREPDTHFGRVLLTLRVAMHLTQAELASMLTLSRHSVMDWESGAKYPKVEHLQAFTVLALQRGAFAEGREAAEIRALWNSADQKILLDEAWLKALFMKGQPSSETAVVLTSSPMPPMDWEEALAAHHFYGRVWELDTLMTWVIKEHCRVVSLLGIGGIGKSSLAVSMMQHVSSQFETVIWRSLRDAPTCAVLLHDLLQTLHPSALDATAVSFDQQLTLLLGNLRDHRTMLVLDNMESVLGEGERSGQMRAGYEDYGRLLRRVAETAHQSCLLLTSREKPAYLIPLEGTHSPVRSLRLARLDLAACEQLLTDKGVTGTTSERAQLIEAYTGNPLALKIVAQSIVDLFDGAITPFMEQGGVIFGGVRKLLDDQYRRLLPVEQTVVFWLAIMREPITLDRLNALASVPIPSGKLLEAVSNLHRRSLIERGQLSGSFTLQSVVLEYITERLITAGSEEIQEGRLVLLAQYGLEQARVKDYVRETQTRLLIAPMVAALQSIFYSETERQLCALLDTLRDSHADTHGYAPANLVALLRTVRGNLRGVDLSGLVLKGVYLQGVDMQDATLAVATIQDCNFTETFDGIVSATMSRDGHYWAVSSETGEVRVWEASGHTLYRIWQSATDIIYRIALSPDGRFLFGGTWDGVLRAREVASGTLRWTISWPEAVSMIYAISVSPDGSLVTSVGDDRRVYVLKADTGEQIEQLPPSSQANIAVWSPDGAILAIGGLDGTICLWAITPDAPIVCVRELKAHSQAIFSLTFSPDGTVIASAGREGVIKFWDVNDGQLKQTVEDQADLVLRARWSPDGRLLACMGQGSIIRLWDYEQGRYRAALNAHTGMIKQALFTPDGQYLISSGADGTLRVWDCATYECIRVMQGHSSFLGDVDWSPDGQQLISGGSDAVVTLYTLDHTQPPRLLSGHIRKVFSVGWSPNGRWAASTEIANILRLWDTTSGACIQVLKNPDDHVNSFYGIAWSGDGERLAVGTDRSGVMVYDLRTQRWQWSGERFPTIVGNRVKWSPDDTRIVTEGLDKVVYIWNVEGKPIQQLVGHKEQVTDSDWSADAARVVSASASELFVWDVERGETIFRYRETSAVFVAVVWGASESVVITGSSDGKLRWWDIQTGACLWVREAHQGSIQAVRKSADRTKLASCGNDGGITIWDLQSGEYLQTVRRDRPYERLDITGIQGLTNAQQAALRALGAVDYTHR